MKHNYHHTLKQQFVSWLLADGLFLSSSSLAAEWVVGAGAWIYSGGYWGGLSVAWGVLGCWSWVVGGSIVVFS